MTEMTSPVNRWEFLVTLLVPAAAVSLAKNPVQTYAMILKGWMGFKSLLAWTKIEHHRYQRRNLELNIPSLAHEKLHTVDSGKTQAPWH